MRLLKENDFKTLEQLCGLTQAGLKKTMSTYLKSKYTHVIETKDYICAEGDIPIALVAHMDTVFARPAQELFYDRQKNVIWSPDGLGADDRAGVFAIIQIIKRGLRPHIILTTDEEQGALGAEALSHFDCPFEDLRYLIQLDRRGALDCVFYSCANYDFADYIEGFGFVEAIGSFSDISVICPAWKIAGVNLSIGYQNEHSVSEILYVGHMLNTIDKVITMLQVEEIPSFEYIASKYESMWYRWLKPTKEDNHCCFCKKEFASDELIPIKRENFSLEHCCIDCLAEHNIDFCSCCGEAYEVTNPNSKLKMCEDCLDDINYRY